MATIDFLERTLEDIVYENRKTIHLRGFPHFKSKAFRQVILPSGKKIDIIGFEVQQGCLVCDIFELKKAVINADAVCQAYGYYQELKQITKPYFKSIEAKIIMVGKKYEPVSILDSLPIPIEVVTYTYQMEGIRFTQITNPHISYNPHESFSLGLWAFGYNGLGFTSDQTSVSFHSAFDDYASQNKGYKATIETTIAMWLREITKYEDIEVDEEIEFPILKPKIITEIFPEPLAWSKEFASGIPYNDILEDFEIDDCDNEIEEDADYSDFEPDLDKELEPDEVWLVNEVEYQQTLEITENDNII